MRCYMEVSKLILLVYPLFRNDKGQRINLARTLITGEFKIQDPLYNTQTKLPCGAVGLGCSNNVKRHSYFGVHSQHLSPAANYLYLFSPFFFIRQTLSSWWDWHSRMDTLSRNWRPELAVSQLEQKPEPTSPTLQVCTINTDIFGSVPLKLFLCKTPKWLLVREDLRICWSDSTWKPRRVKTRLWARRHRTYLVSALLWVEKQWS